MHLPLICNADMLADYVKTQSDDTLAKLRIVDLSSEENYLNGHVPRAIHLPAARLQLGSGAVPNKLPSKDQLAALVADLQLDPDVHVVAYDDQKGPLAGRLIWTLNLLGYQHCSLLNGHLASWTQAGYPTESRPNTLVANVIDEPKLNLKLLTSKEELLENLDNQAFAIWDARSAAEFRGEKVINAKKGGHIPHAKNFEWTQCFSDNIGTIKPAEQLRDELAQAGITVQTAVTTHCQTHRRSGLTYIAGKYAGLDMRCYDGSWFEWGNDDKTPTED